jgi:hypothetical protein
MLVSGSKHNRGIVQEAYTPNWGKAVAKLTTRTILNKAKARFSSSTQGASRSPVNALSCSTRIHQAMTDKMNQRVTSGLDLRNPSSGDQRSTPIMNIKPVIIPNAALMI